MTAAVLVQLDCASLTVPQKLFLCSCQAPLSKRLFPDRIRPQRQAQMGWRYFIQLPQRTPQKEPGGSQPWWRSVDRPSVSTVMEYWCVLPELISLQKDVEVSLSLTATRTSSTSESSVSEPFLPFHSHLSHVWLHENRATITS